MIKTHGGCLKAKMLRGHGDCCKPTKMLRGHVDCHETKKDAQRALWLLESKNSLHTTRQCQLYWSPVRKSSLKKKKKEKETCQKNVVCIHY